MAGKSKKDWSKDVTLKSRALVLEDGVFTWQDPKRIAGSLKKSAEESTNRKGTSFQSAMSMLNFYINRAGKNLDLKQRKILEQAKKELRIVFGKNKKYEKGKGY
jgi:hypothetical protein